LIDETRALGFVLTAMVSAASVTAEARDRMMADMRLHPNGAGWIEVICGPMFSGKTEELIRRLRRARFARQSVEIFKPSVDDRYARHEVVSHSSQRVEAVPLPSASSILEVVDPDTEVVGIDEVQFFEDEVLEVADALAAEGRRVVLAGLDTDYTGRPFEPVPALMARAEYVTKLLAICVRCGSPANRSLRVGSGTTRVEVGARDRYEAVCRTCHHGARRDGGRAVGAAPEAGPGA
jgi:thymidine kinase